MTDNQITPKEQAIQNLKNELNIATSMLVPVMLAEIAIMEHGATLEEINVIFTEASCNKA